MSGSDSHAVFLSYASQDAEAARRIGETLRAAGVEVWFDQNELVGGDAWDAKIRGQVASCALFVPIVSANTEARLEGYFRIEWKLAAQRTHAMADEKAFLLPVVIDGTRDAEAKVPVEFRAVQWTRLAKGAVSAAFVQRVASLLGGSDVARVSRPVGSEITGRETRATPKVGRRVAAAAWIGAAAAVAIGIAATYFVTRKPAAAVPTAHAGAGTRPPTAEKVVPAIPEKSVAVLPFANFSTEKDNEVLVEGMHDDVITNLQKIRDLKVISRTSVLAYRDATTRNLAKIADDLGVATVVEGSVRKIGTKVKVNAKLLNARTEASLWADTLDGDASDPFALQAAIAQRIAGALNATLSGSERALIDRRPTRNQEAYQLYSRGRLVHQGMGQSVNRTDYERVIAFYEQAVALDPDFALAHCELARLHGQMFWFPTVDPVPERRSKALEALAIARRLAPDAPETHAVTGALAYTCDNDWHRALAEFRLAEPGLPNDAQLQLEAGLAHRRLGQWAEAVTRMARAVSLNPHVGAMNALCGTLLVLRRFAETKDAATRFFRFFPDDGVVQRSLAQARYALDGDRAAFVRAWRSSTPSKNDQGGLRLVYQAALVDGDLAAASRVLADTRIMSLPAAGGALLEPVQLRRAMIAYLQGHKSLAREFADEAAAAIRRQTWMPRQQPSAKLALAEAAAYAGRGEEAVRDGQAALAEYGRFDEFDAKENGAAALGRIYVVLGRNEDALQLLRKAMSEPGPAPFTIRHDPVWSLLKDDPRFEEILKAAKAL